MIVSKITMGLGNQMFQYAAAKSLALHKKVPLTLDVSAYEGYNLRKFELAEIFNLQAEQATKQDIEKYRIKQPLKSLWNALMPFNRMYFYHLPYEMTKVKRTLLQLAETVSPSHKKKTFIEPYYHYNSNFFKTRNDVFLVGYWMSWKYFEKFDQEIRQDFTVRNNLVSHLSNIENEIRNSDSVSIHIRRSDFTSEKNTKLHGIVPLSFYREAIKRIATKYPALRLYIFSDDIHWVKDNFTTEFPVVFVSNDISKTAFEDFYLMSICKHNVIANSTFSWWAAYLNNNAGKMVIAPKKWYNKSPYNYKDVYPTSWITIGD